MNESLPKIFVSIASYRDPECQHTIRDLFLKAAHPERIIVGVCWQFEPVEDDDCFEIEAPYPDQLRELRYMAADSKGSCWARAQALSLAWNEEYVLQIDSHMRFVAGWDDTLIDTLNRCPSQPAALTTTLPSYWPPDKLEDFTGFCPVGCVLRVGGADSLQPVSLGGYKRLFERLGCKGPIPAAFFVGNFLFARREMFERVPFDPHIYFRGQEATYSLRLWTHGYDLYHPDSVVMYHYWESKSRGQDKQEHYKNLNDKALKARQRVWHLLGVTPTQDAEALAEIERYGLGTERSPESFWDYAGINLHTGEITQRAHYGRWVDYKKPAA